MKCSELYRVLIKDGWFPVSQKGSHVKMKHDKKSGLIIFPNHGSQEVGKTGEKNYKRCTDKIEINTEIIDYEKVKKKDKNDCRKDSYWIFFIF
ncbi:MAG: type II toxin-antitoxin system HicA family toxin [Bacteroidales bacterium]|nr:type II toxin-antitoxin system HicA family toxin [Bacteroidales bacterium]